MPPCGDKYYSHHIYSMMQTEIQHVCRKFGGKSVGILLFIDQTGFSPCGEKKVRELEVTV
jgi:hypothetical protein